MFDVFTVLIRILVLQHSPIMFFSSGEILVHQSSKPCAQSNLP